MGIWPYFENWKQLIVDINEDIATKFDKEPYAIWDFGGYNTLTTEIVPPLGKKTYMKWHHESVHFFDEAGDVVLNKVLGEATQVDSFPGVGILIHNKNLEDHLKKIRLDRQQYREQYPNEFNSIRNRAKRLGNTGCEVLN